MPSLGDWYNSLPHRAKSAAGVPQTDPLADAGKKANDILQQFAGMNLTPEERADLAAQLGVDPADIPGQQAPPAVPMPKPPHLAGGPMKGWTPPPAKPPPPPVTPPPLPTPPKTPKNQPLTFQQQLLQTTGQQLMGGGSFSQLGSTIGGLAGGPEGYVIGAVIGGLADLPKKLKEFGDGLLKAREPLAEFNGAIGAAFARLQAERIGRTMEFGARTAGSVERLTNAQSRYEQSVMPFEALAERLMNNFMANLLDTGADWIERGSTALSDRLTTSVIGAAATAALKWLTKDEPLPSDPVLNAVVSKLAAIPINLRRKPPTARAKY